MNVTRARLARAVLVFRCRLKSTKHKYLVSWRMTDTIQLSYLGIRTLEQTQGGPVSFLDIPPASTEQIPQFFGNQTHTSGNTRQGRELATGYCAKLNGHNGDCNHFISREQSYTYNYWPLSTHGDCRNSGHGAAYKLWSLWWRMAWLCATINRDFQSING